MIRLLIVDNERLIVDSLLDLFSQPGKLELELFGAYSAAEALDVLERTKIDIVLSDIRMPGMDGLELQREIVKQWPWCKVVFLTGYDDFDYIQQVMRNGGVDYLLKSEGPDAIVRAVEQAAARLYEAVESERLIRKAESQMQLARPLLLNDYLLEAIQGNTDSLRKMEATFAELQAPLSGNCDVMLALGRVDDWRDELSFADKELMLYAIRNIAEEYFSNSARCLTVGLEKNKLLWIIQPKDETETDESRKRLVRFVQGTIETIQIACKQLLKLCVSFAASHDTSSWEHAPERFHALKRLLGRGLGLGKELILFDSLSSGGIESGPIVQTHEVRNQLEKLNTMAVFLDNGERQHFYAEYSKLMGLVAGSADSDDYLQLEIYYSLVSLFLSYMNRWGLHAEIGRTIDLGKLARYDAHRSWGEVEEYFTALADILFEQKRIDQLYREDDLIKHVQLYVERNLAGDLSLTRIGEVVGYNPYYLTRLYKQITNEGLTDFIAGARLAKAQRLLANNQMIVQDISKAVGFMTEQSFYRFFKRATQLTPQEYRERNAFSKKDNEK